MTRGCFALSRALGLDLPGTLVFDYPTISALVAYAAPLMQAQQLAQPQQQRQQQHGGMLALPAPVAPSMPFQRPAKCDLLLSQFSPCSHDYAPGKTSQMLLWLVNFNQSMVSMWVNKRSYLLFLILQGGSCGGGHLRGMLLGAGRRECGA